MKPRTKTNAENFDHVDISKPVRVYRNLHKNCLSVMQGGIVKCHAENIVLKNVRFIVNAAGQRKVRASKRKNVHAFIEGILAQQNEIDLDICECITYNPYKHDGFVQRSSGRIVKMATYCDIEADHKVAPILASGVVYHDSNTND